MMMMALLKNKWHDDVNEVLASASCGNRTRSRTNGSAFEARNLLGVISETAHHNRGVLQAWTYLLVACVSSSASIAI